MCVHFIAWTLRIHISWSRSYDFAPGGGGDSAYEKGGGTRRKFWIKLLKETDLGVAQAFFDR